MTPARATFRRWRDIFAYSALGLWFGAFAAVVYYRLWQLVFRLSPQSWVDFQYPFMAGTSGLFLIALFVVTRARGRHARYFWRYPPFWVAPLIIGTAVLAAALAYHAALAAAELCLACVALASCWIVSSVVLPFVFRIRSVPAESEESLPKKLEELTDSELQAWLNDERAIESVSQDFFGAQDRARRVWNALKTHRSTSKPNLMQTVVLEGPFGSGKTSVIRLLEGFIAREDPENYLLIAVSAWGFSSSAARQHILNQVVEKLSNDVDCLGVRDLPADYVDALMESSKWFALLRPSLSGLPPVKRLQRLLPLLAAVDVHLVVIIEDSDRNDVEFNPQHLQSMLVDFREVERLSFVLTVGSTSKVDFPKIAEQIESIPNLSQGETLSIVNKVRDYCRQKWPVIDPITDEPQ